MKTVTSRLSIPRLLVPVSATRVRIDLEVLYSHLKQRNKFSDLCFAQVQNNYLRPCILWLQICLTAVLLFHWSI